MANRLTSLLSMMILSTIFLLQFRFDLSAFTPEGPVSHPKPPGGGLATEHGKRCKGILSKSEKMDCAINSVQSFCQVPTIIDAKRSKQADSRIDLQFQCQGEKYTEFGQALHTFADDVPTHGDSWGRREFGLPSNKIVLMLGNSDTQQVAHTLACQHVGKKSKITSIQAPLSDKQTAQKITFANNSTLVIITDDKIAETPPDKISKAIKRETGFALSQYDGMIWGLFQECDALTAATCPSTTAPLYFSAADQFEGPMLFIGMMADIRMNQAYEIRDKIREYKAAGRRNLWFIMGRRYISKIKLEGATMAVDPDDKDADNKSKTGKYGHRCTGAMGGHADLLAFDLTEFLYNALFFS